MGVAPRVQCPMSNGRLSRALTTRNRGRRSHRTPRNLTFTRESNGRVQGTQEESAIMVFMEYLGSLGRRHDGGLLVKGGLRPEPGIA